MLSIASAAFAFQGSDLVTKFNEWKLTHAKTYASSDAEASALAAFASNEAIINEHNGKGSSCELGHNEFSDLTWEEFKRLSELFMRAEERPPLYLNRASQERAPLARPPSPLQKSPSIPSPPHPLPPSPGKNGARRPGRRLGRRAP